MEDYSEKMQRCNQYIDALEEERRKIQVFQRELPLCLELVTQAIEGCRQQLPCSGTTDYFHRRQQQSDCSEQTSSDGPVLEEFIPIKKCSSDDDENDDDDEEQSHKPNINTEKSGKKLDWLRSVQLWNQTPDPPHKQDSPEKESVTEVKKNGGAFRPFNKQKDVGKSPAQKDKSPPAVPTAAASSSAGTDSGGSGGGRREDHKQGESQRKQRRCWSPELHRRFLNALQQLGGPHVATPKQIREFMKVDGLTNDEVKSHLQKYRLHTRRPSSGIHNNGSPQAPQFVVVGGIWVQPSEYAKMGATTQSGEATGVATSNGIYAPVAALPPPSLTQASSSVTQRQRKHKQPKHSHSEERGSHCNSPATSSSTHTTTASPVY